MTWARDVAARTIYQEARGEPEVGQKAVAHVILNRLKTGRWGNNLASVCLWPWQFSGWHSAKDPNFKLACELADDSPALLKMRKILDGASIEADPTSGATHYFATYIDAPPWTQGATFCGQIGQHKFYKDVK
jgi:N-acetylmuramoyl-L-alanine amidase